MEICVDCVESAKNAEAGGASRLELCSALSEGGLTPTEGLLRVVKSLVSIPVFVMIRPRRGLDFVYSKEELKIMEYDIKSLKAAGADGFVFGALTRDRKVNIEDCSLLLKAAAPSPCTFHRAFDVTQDPLGELETIISLGFRRILTSGQKQTASEGVGLIRELVNRSKDRVSIMPGAGVSKNNLEYILRESATKEFHASARTPFHVFIDNRSGNKNVSMGASDSDTTLLVTDTGLVADMVRMSKSVWGLTS